MCVFVVVKSVCFSCCCKECLVFGFVVFVNSMCVVVIDSVCIYVLLCVGVWVCCCC